jgi:hypothetical protein
MPRRLCSVCTHPAQQVRDWYDQGKSVTFICSQSPEPKLLPSDVEFHSRHSSRKVTLADSATAVESSSDVHETRESRREELKKKLDRVSKLLDSELDSPSSPTGRKAVSQEYRMLMEQLNQMDAEIAAQTKAEAKRSVDGQFILPLNPHLENGGGNPSLEHHYLSEGELLDDERGRGRGRTLAFQDFDALLRLRLTLEAGRLLANVTDRDPTRQTQKRLGHALANLGSDYPYPKDFDPQLVERHASLTMAEIAERKQLMNDVQKPAGYDEYKAEQKDAPAYSRAGLSMNSTASRKVGFREAQQGETE